MKKVFSIIMIVIIMTFMSLGTSVFAKGKPDNPGKGKGQGRVQDSVETVEVVERDSDVIQDEEVDDAVPEDETTEKRNQERNEKVKALKARFREVRKNKEERKRILQEIAQVKKEMNDKSVGVFANGKEVKFDVPPVIKEGRTLIPVRAVMNSLGAEVQWDAETRTVIITKQVDTTVTDSVYGSGSEIEIKLQIDSNIAYVNGEEHPLDVPATLHSNRTVVPIRFISEALGANIEWDEDSSTVIIEDEEEESGEEDAEADVEDSDNATATATDETSSQ